jgi:hypothetical protein
MNPYLIEACSLKLHFTCQSSVQLLVVCCLPIFVSLFVSARDLEDSSFWRQNIPTIAPMRLDRER